MAHTHSGHEIDEVATMALVLVLVVSTNYQLKLTTKSLCRNTPTESCRSLNRVKPC